MEMQTAIMWAAVGLMVMLAIVGIVDVYLGGTFGDRATVSYQIRTWCARWPILYVALAWLLFHVTQVPCKD